MSSTIKHMNAALFNELPNEILQHIGSHASDSEDTIIDDNGRYKRTVRESIRRCSFSKKFAIATLFVFTRSCTVQLPSSAIIGMSQETPSGPLQCAYRRIIIFDTRYRYSKPYTGRMLPFNAAHLRRLDLGVEFRMRSPNCDCVGLAKMIPDLHHVFPTLEELQVSITTEHFVSYELWQREWGFRTGQLEHVVAIHDKVLQVAVALNRAQSRVRWTSILVQTITRCTETCYPIWSTETVETTGRWEEVMVRFQSTAFFVKQRSSKESDLWYLGWLALGSAGMDEVEGASIGGGDTVEGEGVSGESSTPLLDWMKKNEDLVPWTAFL